MKLEFCLNPEQADLDCVRDGIRSYNRKHLPEGEVNAVGALQKMKTAKSLAALLGKCLKIRFLWSSCGWTQKAEHRA